MSALFPIPRSQRRLDLVAAASQTVFTVDFPVLDAGDVSVARQISGNTYFTALIAGVDFVVSGVSAAGATVTLISPAGAGDVYRISGARVASRTSSLPPSGSKMRPSLEGELDAINLSLQELRREADRIEAFVNGGISSAASQPEAEAGILNSVNMTPLRTLQALQKRFVFITDSNFGAATTASASANATAINAAITAVFNAGGGIVFVPVGTFNVDPVIGITMKTGVSLVGVGRDVSILKASAALTTRDFVAGSGVTVLKVEGITLDGQSFRGGTATATGSNGANTITVTGVTGTIANGMLVTGTNIAKNCTVTNYNSGTGVVTLSGNNTGAVATTVTFDGTYAMLAFQSYNEIDIVNCTIKGFVRFGLTYSGGSYIRIFRNKIRRTGTAVFQNQAILASAASGANNFNRVCENDLINSGMDLDINRSFVTDNSVSGFGFGAGITTEQSATCYANKLDDNIITGGTGVDDNAYNCGGIETWCYGSTVVGNIILSNGGTGIDQGGMRNVVGMNVVFNNGMFVNSPGITTRYGTASYNGSESVIIGNRCFDTAGAGGTQTYGYTDQNSSPSYVVVVGNSFKQNKTGAVNAAATVSSFLGQELTGSTAWNPGTIASPGFATAACTVSGAVVGDKVTCSFTQDIQGVKFQAWVSSPNTVSFRFENNTGAGVTIASGTAYAFVQKRRDSADF